MDSSRSCLRGDLMWRPWCDRVTDGVLTIYYMTLATAQINGTHDMLTYALVIMGQTTTTDCQVTIKAGAGH